MSEVVLTIGGQRHRGWKSVDITRGIERVAHSFELTVTDNWGSGDRRTIRTGEPCTIHLDNELLLTGYTDHVSPSYDASSHTITVQGRSKTADLVDCSEQGHPPFRNQTLTRIANKLCQPFQISVVENTDPGKPFEDVSLDDGQPIFEFLEYLARIRAVRLITNPNGDLVITNAGTTSADIALEFGNNILAARGSFDLSQAYQRYTVTGQRSDQGFVDHDIIGEASDARVERYRPLAIISDGPIDTAGAKTRAEWEASTRYGRSRPATFTVQSWQQTPNGRSWVPNEKLQIRDPYLAMTGDYLISETRMVLDDQGARTELTVMPKEAFDLVTLPEPELETGWGP